MMSKPDSGGFTLIELLMILVIIGMFAGGVWRGKVLLDRSRISQAVLTIRDTVNAVASYQASYGAMPGDDGPGASLPGRGEDWSSVGMGGDGDGRLEALGADTFNPGTEAVGFWRQLRAAGLIPGDPAVRGLDGLPANDWGGLIGITSEAVQGGLEGICICLSQVPGSAALAIDREMDDGVGASGRLRATRGEAGNDTAPSIAVLGGDYDRLLVYTLCYRL